MKFQLKVNKTLCYFDNLSVLDPILCAGGVSESDGISLEFKDAVEDSTSCDRSWNWLEPGAVMQLWSSSGDEQVLPSLICVCPVLKGLFWKSLVLDIWVVYNPSWVSGYSIVHTWMFLLRKVCVRASLSSLRFYCTMYINICCCEYQHFRFYRFCNQTRLPSARGILPEEISSGNLFLHKILGSSWKTMQHFRASSIM